MRETWETCHYCRGPQETEKRVIIVEGRADSHATLYLHVYKLMLDLRKECCSFRVLGGGQDLEYLGAKFPAGTCRRTDVDAT